jgi:hypothetical protein
MNNRFKWLIVFILLLAPAAGASGNLVKKHFDWHQTHFGMKLGINNLGTARVNGQKYDTRVGLSGGFYFDFVATKNLFWGVMIDFQDIQFFEEREAMFNLSVGLKPVYYRKDAKIAYKPAFSIGLADLGHIGNLKRTQYLTLKGSFELVFFTESKYILFGEFGVWGAPMCFNDEYDITLGPFMQIRIGVMFLS